MRLIAISLSVLLTACCAVGRGDAGAKARPASVQSDVAVDGGTIHVEVGGAGEAVLLIHGGFGDSRMWDGQLAALESRFRVVRMDLRGFGQSSMPTAAYSPVADVLVVLDRFDIAKVHLVGNSMGGGLAIDFALAHPERVASMTVVSSGPNGFPATAEDKARFAPDLESIRAVFRAVSTEGVERGVALWEAHPMVAVAHADPRVAPLLHRMIDDNRRLFTLEYWPDDNKQAVDHVGEIRVPALFIVGERDIAMVRGGVDYAARRIPGARVVTIPGTDHLPQMEQPEQFNRVLLEFLDAR